MDSDERVPRVGEVRIQVRPDYYLLKARHEVANGNNVGAIQHYLSYIENLGSPHDMLLSEQINLTKLIMSLSENVDPSEPVQNEIIKCYLTMLNGFPHNAILLNAFGLYFFTHGEYTVARSYLQRAAAEGYLPAEKNFLHVIWHLLPRWHFRMLNDQKRNEFFRDAIHKALKAGYKKVYDIGTGCGLLTLIAATYSQDVRVIAIEESKMLCDLTGRIFKNNNLENVKLIQGNSNTIKTAPAPCNLIVTEIFDAAVFGESCLKTIKHALDTFIKGNNFKIIPAGVKLYVTAFESHELTRKFRYTESLKELKLENVCLVEVDPEPYDAEYLKNRSLKYLSDTKQFLEVNFYNKKQLDELLNPESGCINEIELVCKSGTIHALAVWFELNLDEEITISTDPFNSNVKCWEQAVFHLDHPIEVKAGDLLKLKPRIVEGQIHFDVLSHENDCEDCFEVSREIISFLNDTELVKNVINAAEKYSGDLRVIDFNVFPLFGFLMAKKGATVYHVYNDECDLNLFNHIIKGLKEIICHKFIFIHHKAVENYLVFLEPPNLVFTDLVKSDGSWSKMEYSLETEAKLNCESLPKKFFLHAQLVSSKYLDICNKVDDSKALNFNIFSEINEFSVSFPSCFFFAMYI